MGRAAAGKVAEEALARDLAGQPELLARWRTFEVRRLSRLLH
jgi:hypothetical protein